MNKPIHPAVAEHVMEENEKLRGLLREMINALRSDRDLGLWQCRQNEADRWEAALSQQAEPACDTCHGQGEVWTGETQHFHYFDFQPPEPVMEACPECGGEAEPDPTQDEREAFALWSVTHTNSGCTDTSGIHAFKAGAAWQRARPAQTEQRPSATQQILDLILEQCRYWHGRDEARRGGFACLYAAAKEVADNAAPVSQPAQTELVEALERARSNFRITLKQLNDVPEAAWNGRLDRAHQYTTQGLQQVEQALSTYRAALAAQGGE
ncbi:hypothetical protein [Stutzerimonas nitrititolerans]|uniref:hypothetical protein n=1 Tax=Stutzerimonas nitrititolerans TaxID=2482751 RepID=UPI0028A58681|nr:hypothetical protein [Stutzerimonas nitrititolerans]